jgi:DNA-directed RNA polymerase specialized sigma24 family protein
MAMADTNLEELAARNDARLRELVHPGAAGVEREIERLIAESQPVIDGILARYTRSRTLVTPEDAEDINSTIHLRLVRKLRGVADAQEEAIENFRGYVATLAYNAVNDHLRKRFPEWTRLKARLRYALIHDSRLAIWPGAAGLLCGLAAWQGREDSISEPPSMTATIAAAGRHDAAAALEQMVRAAGGPLLFDDAVDLFAEAWSVVDLETTPLDGLSDAPVASTRLEDFDFARSLWVEIRELRPMQRKALLLNLRYGGETNIVSLLVLGGIARFDDIAEALEMSGTELASIWRLLPIDDSTLALRFGVTRQQIVNLRKAARDRLNRRLRR